jgi:excisionase family DNA binding protein
MTESVLSPLMDSPATLIDVEQVASLLRCSPRTVYRLSNAGRMPAPVRLGSLVRWRRGDVEAWIAGGCKTVRSVTGKRNG